MKKYRVIVNDNEYVVSVEPLTDEEAEQPSQSTPSAEKSAAAPTTAAAEPAVEHETVQQPEVDADGIPVEAPLRGSIIRILVEEGAAVKEGDVLLTLEALKLENEITAPADGVVAQILVREGDSVDPGHILATLRNEA